MNVLSLFDGMSCGRIALEKADIQVDNYYSSEIDKYAIQIATKNHPDNIHLGSVVDLTPEQLLHLDIDLIIGGSPCQGFSNAGKLKGSTTKCGIDVVSLEQYIQLKEDQFEFDGQSYLFWEYIRIKEMIKPKYFFLENVRVTKKWLPMFNEAMGVEPIKINSSLVSAQNRVRYYWTNIPNPTQPEDRNIMLRHILEDIPIDKPLVPNMTGNFGGVNRLDKGIYNFIDKAKGVAQTAGAGHGNKYLISRPNEVHRKLTPMECERLQTVPDGYTEGVSNTQRYKMIGNGWTVDVITHLFQGLTDETKIQGTHIYD